ncbi:MAG: hypothetical protein KJO54_13630 [Gammaproteobacteria bacterium]|nr:hypothetical protein [Gammaproteobacteria bacterium]NNF59867.1 hypothetical protein [Gammaproteobacteria bacterium]NNM21492.1 hypothetical protein [Gammaproteobacteria bacterium]
MRLINILLLISLAALTACAGAPSRLDNNFGDSVRSMVYNQIADPAVAANPDPAPVEGFDGEKGEVVLHEYQDNVTKPEQISNEIHLNIGR